MDGSTTAKAGIAFSLAFAALLHASMATAAETVTAGAAPATNPPVAASIVSAELMKSIRAATFEVVLKKAETDTLTYDKPLPVDLLPFAERNDKYRSIGTAFAIAPGSFVTAAHVTGAASGSQLGVPALRDAQGNIYPIDRVTKFSQDRDFIVFTVTGAPKVTPLPTSTAFTIDTAVIAVGNALGQGIVGRDGVLTSETPEDVAGAWKWLRFSAPASPGNSGGPLLDAQGRVIGVIARKSANENLNFALPISLVLNAPTNKGSIESRVTVNVPVLISRKTASVKTSFDLPMRFSEFDSKLRAANDGHYESIRAQMLQESAADLFPRGKSGRLLADTFLNNNPAIIAQQSDGNWDIARNVAGSNVQLGNDGFIWMGVHANTPLFRIKYPGDVDIAQARSNSKLLSEHLMKGIRLGRPFGTENVRITSLGDAGKPLEFKDDFGRIWLQWRYPMAFSDNTMVVMALPTPEGFIGYMRNVSGGSLERVSSEMRLLINFTQAAYTGSLPQWRSFLADTRLRPESFGKWKAALDPAGEISLELPRFTMKIDRQVLNLTDKSQLNIITGTMLDGDRAAWDVLGASFALEARQSPGVGVIRRSKPSADAGQIPVNRWEDMVQQRGPFSGSPVRNPQGGIGRKVVGADGKPLAEATFLYELNYATTTQVQGEIQRALPRLTEMVHILEK